MFGCLGRLVLWAVVLVVVGAAALYGFEKWFLDSACKHSGSCQSSTPIVRVYENVKEAS